MSVTEVIRAAWVATMAGPPLRDAAVAFAAGRVLDVGPAQRIVAAHPEARITDLGDSILLPGLVNAHTHLELSDQRPGERAGSFADWLIRVMTTRNRSTPEELAAATRAGIEQSIGFGVTCVGDISRECRVTRPVIAASPIRAVSYGEVQAFAKRRHLLDDRLEAAVDTGCATERLTIGITPHAPYTVESQAFAACLAAAKERHMPLATHLAESPEEAPFLADHAGGFRRLWDTLGWWDDAVPRFTGGPIRFAKSLGLLDYPTLLAHVNYADDAELAILAKGQPSVVYCPRTHAYFGHPPHRWREMLKAGINVAIGTDSRASSPNLNLVDELRLLRKLAPDLPADELWPLATTRAAKAIGLDSVGSIATGKVADFVAFPAVDEPLETILQQPMLPTHVWIGGALQSR